MKKIAMAAIVALVAAMSLTAAHVRHTYGQDTGPKAAKPYSPRIGDIMILMQIRHAKLWFAGNARNWALADFELDEIKEGLEDVEKLFPTIDGVATPPVIDALNGGEIAQLAKAMELRDRAKFVSAFDRLTAACNACHQVTKHAFIVVQRPTAPPLTNQSFAPQRQDALVGSRKDRQ
jgi:hypothetical protein